MSARSGLGFVALFLALVSSAPGPAAAFPCTPAKRKTGETRCHVGVHWAERTVPYVVELPAETRTERALLLSSITASFQRWQAPRCTDLRFESRGTIPALAEGQMAPAPLVVTPVPFGWEAGPGVVAVTTTGHSSDTGAITRVTLELNEQDFTFVDGAAACTSEMDLEGTLTHEIGHAIGFAHPCEEDESNFSPCGNERCDAFLARLLAEDSTAKISTMWPTVVPCSTELRSLESEDTAAVCFVYPAGASTRPCRPLPPQPAPYVGNGIFGCAAIEVGQGAPWGWLVVGAGLTLRRRAGKFVR